MIHQIYAIFGSLINLHPEYNQMSLRPGVGASWYEKYKTDVFPSDFLIHHNQTIKVPRYYEKLYENAGSSIEPLKLKRKVRARKQQENNTPERLAVREKIKILNYKQLTRNYEL